MDEQEFIHQITQHRGMLFKVTRMFVEDNTEAQDLMQDILLQLWSSMKRFDGSVKFSTWMYRVALNTSMAYVRKSKRSEVVNMGIISITDNTYDERWDAVEFEIRQLPMPNRAILLLHLEGHKNGEIAEILGLSLSNISTRLNRVKNILKKKFSKDKEHHGRD